jgi:branched-chain amino acid transport system permease protein
MYRAKQVEVSLNYEFISISLLNGISYGLLLFLLSAGLTLILSMMGVLNFAHASFYMLGAYFGYTISQYVGFWGALVLAPLAVGILGALIEKYGLRRTHKFGHVPELLFTFGLTFIIVELVQLFWGRNALPFRAPDILEGSAFTIFTSTFPKYKVFMMVSSLFMLLVLYLGLTRTRVGLIIQAALTHPETVQALGHNVPRVFMMVFGGGTALAALAGVIGGPAFVTDPAMGATVGSIIFVVVVVGGMGSLAGAFVASLLIGCLQTFAVGIETSLLSLLAPLGVSMDANTFGYAVMGLKISQIAPILPYLLLVLILIFRPKGLLGTREG